MNDEAARRKAEEGRVEAEDERVAHEEDRRVAEGGNEHAQEQGRVEAEERREVSESDRVLAEEKRGSLRAFYTKLATFVALPIAFVALMPALVGLYLNNRRADENRELIEQVVDARADIVTGFKRADLALCRSANEQGDILADLIRGVEKEATDISEESRRQFQLALVRLAPRDCSKLPNQKRNP
ncbi:MAG: hypothetical protein H0U46_07875 [Actinobacteria bacterium]|nr:hypothetical protein [Actinomycetota bacterium]